MKNVYLFSAALFLLGCTTKQEPTNPDEFPPKGWELLSQGAVDFNKDEICDYVYVIQEKEVTKSSEDGNCAGAGGKPYHRKELIIKFGLKDGMETVLRTSKVFGKCNWGVQGTDAFVEVGTRRNTIKLSFLIGGSLRSKLDYYFRYQDAD